MCVLQSWCVHRGCAWLSWTPSHLNRAAAFPEMPDIGPVSFNSFLMRLLDVRGYTIRICSTLLYQHRGTRVQDNTAFVFPLFLYLFSVSRVKRDSKPLLAVCSFLQQGNLKVLKKREFRFVVLVGYSHQLKTESRLLAQRELHVVLCPYMCHRESSKERQTFQSCLHLESLSLTVLNGGHLEALTLLVYA